MNLLPPGKIKRIHVNRHVLARNLKTGEDAAAISIQTGGGVIRAVLTECPVV